MRRGRPRAAPESRRTRCRPRCTAAAYAALGLTTGPTTPTRCASDGLAGFLAGLGRRVARAVADDAAEGGRARRRHLGGRRGAGGPAPPTPWCSRRRRAARHNTDVAGHGARPCEAATGRDARPRALVLGAGATARSAVLALAELGVATRHRSRSATAAGPPRPLARRARPGHRHPRRVRRLGEVPCGPDRDDRGRVDAAGAAAEAAAPSAATPADRPAVLLDVVYAGWPTPLARGAARAGGRGRRRARHAGAPGRRAGAADDRAASLRSPRCAAAGVAAAGRPVRRLTGRSGRRTALAGALLALAVGGRRAGSIRGASSPTGGYRIDERRGASPSRPAAPWWRRPSRPRWRWPARCAWRFGDLARLGRAAGATCCFGAGSAVALAWIDLDVHRLPDVPGAARRCRPCSCCCSCASAVTWRLAARSGGPRSPGSVAVRRVYLLLARAARRGARRSATCGSRRCSGWLLGWVGRGASSSWRLLAGFLLGGLRARSVLLALRAACRPAQSSIAVRAGDDRLGRRAGASACPVPVAGLARAAARTGRVEGFTPMLRWLTAGESHGPALVATLEGLPADVQVTTRRRRRGPGPPAARLRPRRPDEVRAGRGRVPRRRPPRPDPGLARSRSGSATPSGPSGRQVMAADPVDAERSRADDVTPAGAGPQRAADPAAARATPTWSACRSTASTRPGRSSSGPRARETAARVALGAVARALPRAGRRHPAGLAHVVDRPRPRCPTTRPLPTPDDVERARRRPGALPRPRGVGGDGRRDRPGPQGRRHPRRRRRGRRLRAAARASARTCTGTAGSTRGSPAR